MLHPPTVLPSTAPASSSSQLSTAYPPTVHCLSSLVLPSTLLLHPHYTAYGGGIRDYRNNEPPENGE